MMGKAIQTSPMDSTLSLDKSCKEQDMLLPIANVGRIMKKALPANAKISKEAKEVVQECVSEFISFITGEASDKCQREKRKTINGDDLLWAMTTLGFENYVGPLNAYLNKYRVNEGEKNGMARQEELSSSKNTNHGGSGKVPELDMMNSNNQGGEKFIGYRENLLISNGLDTGKFYGIEGNAQNMQHGVQW